MATIVAWLIIGWAFVAITMTRPMCRAVLWMLDTIDRWTNPVTRARIRRHNEIVAQFMRDVEKHNAGRN